MFVGKRQFGRLENHKVGASGRNSFFAKYHKFRNHSKERKKKIKRIRSDKVGVLSTLISI